MLIGFCLETLWRNLKKDVRFHKKVSSVSHILEKLGEAFDHIKPSHWQSFCDGVDAFHDEMWSRVPEDEALLTKLGLPLPRQATEQKNYDQGEDEADVEDEM